MRQRIINFVAWDSGQREILHVENETVVWRGPEQEAPEFSGTLVDCQGKRLFPAFVDCHCHILSMGQDLLRPNLMQCTSREQVLDEVRDAVKKNPEGWMMAVQYDQNRFSDGQHLSASDLDEISATQPILLRHANGHASVANSAALRAAKVDATTTDPEGGVFVRDSSGDLTGVLLEKAHEDVTAAIPDPTEEEMVEAILRAGERMHELGISCASDMLTGRYDLETELRAYRVAAERDCKVRMRLYSIWSKTLGPRGISSSKLREHAQAMNSDRCRVAGIKIFADGAIASATAGIYGHFVTNANPTGDTDGQLIYSPEKLKQMVIKAHDEGWQVAVHAIGDYAVDLVLDAYEATGEANRHRLEHAMILSDLQIERIAKCGCHVSMQPEFLMRFGPAYIRQLGSERASKLKRIRSILDAGIPLSLSSDRPIVPGDPRDGIRCAVNRPNGFDPSENCTEAEAFRMYTEMGAHANGEAGKYGQLRPGQFAEFRLE